MRKIKLFEEFEVEPRKEQEFPCTFTIITDKSDRNTNQPRSIKNDGYIKPEVFILKLTHFNNSFSILFIMRKQISSILIRFQMLLVV